jgi:hypothetical protein
MNLFLVRVGMVLPCIQTHAVEAGLQPVNGLFDFPLVDRAGLQKLIFFFCASLSTAIAVSAILFFS